MANPWYRAWVGLVSDPKISEAALVADVSVSIVVAVWHATLESASDVDDGGAFSTNARRIGSILREPTARIEAVFAALAELGMIRDGVVVAWDKRQPARESNADNTERQRRFRARKTEAPDELPLGELRNTPSRDVTRPDADADSEAESKAAAAARAPEIDLAAAKPLPTRDLLEAEVRALMGDRPLIVDLDFSPVSSLLTEPGITRADVLAGAFEAAERSERRMRSWRDLAPWIRQAAKNRLAASTPGAGARAPPGSGGGKFNQRDKPSLQQAARNALARFQPIPDADVLARGGDALRDTAVRMLPAR